MDLAGFQNVVVVTAALFAAAGICAAVGITNAAHQRGRVPVEATAACQDRIAPPLGSAGGQ